jgi:hypothetical protein
MTSKSKKIVGWLVGIFLVFPFALTVLISIFSSSEGNNENIEMASPICVKANSEDLKNLKEGLTDKSLSLSNGFVGEFAANDIEDIKAIFPTYTSPRVVAAQIDGPSEGSVIGLWGIQDFDYGWRILALNKEARAYSVQGVDVDDDSASGQVRNKMLELSSNTSVLDCTNLKQ